MWTKTFWAQVAERAVKTFAQASVALLVGDGLNLLTVDWVAVGSAAGLAAVVSVLMSLASKPVGDGESPSLVPTVPRPSAEAVRILTTPAAERAVSEAVREAVRKLGPGGLR